MIGAAFLVLRKGLPPRKCARAPWDRVRCMVLAAREGFLARGARSGGCLVSPEADGAVARARFQDPCVRASFGHEP